MRLLNIIFIISIIIFYITYIIYYNEFNILLYNSELSKAIESNTCIYMQLILITLLCTISSNSMIMGSYIKPAYCFSLVMYIVTALMTIDIYITKSSIRYIFYGAIQKLLAIWGGCLLFTIKKSTYNSWLRLSFFIISVCSLYASVIANIPIYTNIANTIRPILITIYLSLIIQMFTNYFDRLKLKYIDLWYVIALPIMTCIDLYICYPYVNRYHGINAVISRLIISIFYFFISSCIENVPLYEAGKRAQRKLLLLRKMFPLKVLNELIEKNEVTPQLQTSVTILFSDIKGFVTICSEISAIDTFSLLNKLYHVLDLCCEICDCYKVETIGDAYMIASGLNDSSSNEVDNAAKVASFGQLVQYLIKYIKLDSGKPIQLRMGIHSGSCVTGIVGELMPRYCLFGDTINVANRLQTNSEVNKIHISDETRSLLSSLDQFETILHNNNTILKGKETRATYWLDTKINSNKNPILTSDVITTIEDKVIKLLKQY